MSFIFFSFFAHWDMGMWGETLQGRAFDLFVVLLFSRHGQNASSVIYVGISPGICWFKNNKATLRFFNSSMKRNMKFINHVQVQQFAVLHFFTRDKTCTCDLHFRAFFISSTQSQFFPYDFQFAIIATEYTVQYYYAVHHSAVHWHKLSIHNFQNFNPFLTLGNVEKITKMQLIQAI